LVKIISQNLPFTAHFLTYSGPENTVILTYIVLVSVLHVNTIIRY